MTEYVRALPDNRSQMPDPRSRLERVHIDWMLVLLLAALTAFGLLVLYSASGQSMAAVIRQARFFAVAWVVMIVAAQFSLAWYQRWAPLFYVIGVCALIGVAVAGSGAKGAQRWLEIGSFRFQPSEIMKLMVPLMVARFLAKSTLPPRFLVIAGSLALLGLPAALILKQPDLGTALLIAASGLFVLFMAGISWRFIGSAVVVLLASAWPVWLYLLKDYQRQRILTLLSPESDKLGAGWNIIQSKTAIGSGGWMGKGWLEGTQSQLDFLPESRTDFIIAVLAEEIGLRGVLVLLTLYLLILLRGIWIGVNAQSTYGRLVAASFTLTFFVYVFVNMGMVAGLLPVVGVPLPLVSRGGTSIVTLMAAFGILMAVSTEHRLMAR
ncbi:MAG: rod shape-determining protein RodA [Gammaproteobacteria bacterium]|nr:MAG: rod shape-determining protein RodA [Gammaproteobacteria bacterium]